jgi:hypothetical protein
MAVIKLRREGDQQESENTVFPKGKYRVKVMGQEQSSGEGKEKNGKKGRPWSALVIDLKFVGGDYAGHQQKFFLFDGREAQLSLFEAAGFEVDREADSLEVNLDDLIGLDLNVFLEPNKAGTYNNVVRFEPAPRTKPAPKAASPTPEPPDEEEEAQS